MLKQYILLLLVAVNVNLNGVGHDKYFGMSREEYLMHKENGSGVYRSAIRPNHMHSVPKSESDAVLRDPDKLRLFIATERILESVYPRIKSSVNICGCYRPSKSIIILDYCLERDFYCVETPWVEMDVVGDETLDGRVRKICRSDIDKTCELMRRNGLQFEESHRSGGGRITILALDGDVLPQKSLTKEESCVMFAAWQQYQSPEARKERAARER